MFVNSKHRKEERREEAAREQKRIGDRVEGERQSERLEGSERERQVRILPDLFALLVAR